MQNLLNVQGQVCEFSDIISQILMSLLTLVRMLAWRMSLLVPQEYIRLSNQPKASWEPFAKHC